MKKKTTKVKKQIQSKVDQILHYYLSGDSKVISKEELGLKFFDSDDPVVCRLICGGYIPEVRRKLEDEHNKTLRNKRGKGWQLTSGGIDTLMATVDAEKRMDAFKNSYARKVKGLDPEKFPEQVRDRIKSLNNLIPLLHNAHAAIFELSSGIQRVSK